MTGVVVLNFTLSREARYNVDIRAIAEITARDALRRRFGEAIPDEAIAFRWEDFEDWQFKCDEDDEPLRDEDGDFIYDYDAPKIKFSKLTVEAPALEGVSE